jgi:hypothetical protein
MFKRTGTDLDTQPTVNLQRLIFGSKIARLLRGGCCCLYDMGSTIVLRINWRRENQVSNVALHEDVHWCEVR